MSAVLVAAIALAPPLRAPCALPPHAGAASVLQRRPSPPPPAPLPCRSLQINGGFLAPGNANDFCQSKGYSSAGEAPTYEYTVPTAVNAAGAVICTGQCQVSSARRPAPYLSRPALHWAKSCSWNPPLPGQTPTRSLTLLARWSSAAHSAAHGTWHPHPILVLTPPPAQTPSPPPGLQVRGVPPRRRRAPVQLGAEPQCARGRRHPLLERRHRQHRWAGWVGGWACRFWPVGFYS